MTVKEVSKRRSVEGGVRTKPNLRLVQKAQTRARILEAALQQFNAVGFYGATIDQIAGAIGASRATFYLHFPDKEAVLKALLDDYLARAVVQMSRMPGPIPSRQQLNEWMAELVAFYETEHLSIAMISEISAIAPSTSGIQEKSRGAIAGALGRNVAAFAKGAGGEAEVEREVTSDSLILHITWAAAAAARRPGSAYAKAALDLAAAHLHQFVSDPRFSHRRRGDQV